MNYLHNYTTEELLRFAGMEAHTELEIELMRRLRESTDELRNMERGCDWRGCVNYDVDEE